MEAKTKSLLTDPQRILWSFRSRAMDGWPRVYRFRMLIPSPNDVCQNNDEIFPWVVGTLAK